MKQHSAPSRLTQATGAPLTDSLNSRYTQAKIFTEVGKLTPTFARFSTLAGELGAGSSP